MASALDGQGDRQGAARCYQQAVAIFRETGDRWALARSLSDLAWRIWDEGRLHEALALVQECLVVFRQLQAQGDVPIALKYIALMAVAVGDFETAPRAVLDEREHTLSGGLWNDAVIRLYTAGLMDFAQGRLRQARQQLESALTMARAEDDPRCAVDVLYLLGRIAVYEGLPDEATDRFEESRRWGQQANPHPIWSAQSLFGLGQVAGLRGDFAHAAALYRESLAQIQVSRPEVPARLEGLAEAAVGLNQGVRAAKLMGAAGCLRTTMGAPILPVDRPRYDETVAALRAGLSEEDFRRAWAAGEAMSVEESLAYALG
jgi:tetratricopeptide (TPR) repeat protein